MKAKQLITTVIASLTSALALTALVAAQQPTADQPQSMDDMMKECRTHCQTTTITLDQLTQQMDNAKQSNDPAQMRAALDAAQQPLEKMKNHMTGCMGMMSKMQNMHGGMGGMMKESSSGHMGGMEGRGGGMMQEKKTESGGESH